MEVRKSAATLAALGLAVAAPAALAAAPAFPSWSQKIEGARRFTVLTAFDGQAVLDNETGLVWERAPGAYLANDWSNAVEHCLHLNVGNRYGWRLPTVVELTTLLEHPAPGVHAWLPSDHPFVVSNPDSYFFSVTRWTRDSSFVHVLKWGIPLDVRPTTFSGYTWCVRGGGANGIAP